MQKNEENCLSFTLFTQFGICIAKFCDENHIAIFAHRTYSLIIFFHRTMRFKMPKFTFIVEHESLRRSQRYN